MKKVVVKRVLSCLICLCLLLSMAACSTDTGKTTTAGEKETAPKTTEAAPQTEGEGTTSAGEQYPEPVTEPITINLWHTMSAGKNAAYLEEAIAAFNASNEYGITVVGTYQGSYSDVFSKTSTALVTDDAPDLVVLDSNGITTFVQDDILADLTDYVERDKFDMDNIAKGMTNLSYYEDQIISMPFIRSTAVFYYNKGIWDELGLEPPTDMEDLMAKAKKITEARPGVYGFSMVIDPYFLQDPLVRSLGGDGLIHKDGNSEGGLTDGTFEKMMTDWLQGVNEGWWFPPTVTSASDTVKAMFYRGEVASFVASCGGLGGVLQYSEESGVDLGVSFIPVYGGYGCVGGGGNICAVGKGKSQQQIAASWEFIRFMMSDEWAAKRAVATGYLPVTNTSTEREEVQTLWKEHPQYKVAFEQLDFCEITPWSAYRSEYRTYLVQAMSYVIQDFSMTPKEAAEYLQEQADIIFP